MSLRNQPYLPLYVLDFTSDEKLRRCSAESYGVYIFLMCLLHRQPEYGVITLKERQKKSDDNVVNFACDLLYQMPFEYDVIERSLRQLIAEEVLSLEGDSLFQRRMVRDGELSKKRAEAGKKGGNQKNQPESTEKIDVLLDTKDEAKSKQTLSKPSSKIQANSENEIEYENENEIEDSTVSRNKVLEDRFDVFWRAYPRKSGKGAARRAWMKIAPSEALLQKMLHALTVIKESDQWKKEKGQFIPYPATWLNQERWDDGDDEKDEGGYNPEDPFAGWGEQE